MKPDSDVSEFVEFELGVSDAVDQLIFNGPEAKLGGEHPDIEARQIRLRIGRRPTILNIRKVYQKLDQECPKNLELFDDYESWIFSFRIHLMKDGGFSAVRQLGAQVMFPEGSGVTIVSLLPDTEFADRGGVHAGASAEVSVTGDAQVPEVSAALGPATIEIGGGIKASASAGAHINVSFSVLTSQVIATGSGDHVGEWSIRRAKEPLLGEQNFLTTILVPTGESDLEVKIRAYVVVATGFFVPARLQTGWITMTLPLQSSAAIGSTV
jgi:hypothetical protein